MNLEKLFEKRDVISLAIQKYFDYKHNGRYMISFIDEYWIDDGDCIWWAQCPEDFSSLEYCWISPLLNRDFTTKKIYIAVDSCFVTAKLPLSMDDKKRLVGYPQVEETHVFEMSKKLELDTSELRKKTIIEFIS
jgi:hypothetical protein